MKPVFKCEYCQFMGTEEEVSEHELNCFGKGTNLFWIEQEKCTLAYFFGLCKNQKALYKPTKGIINNQYFFCGTVLVRCSFGVLSVFFRRSKTRHKRKKEIVKILIKHTFLNKRMRVHPTFLLLVVVGR